MEKENTIFIGRELVYIIWDNTKDANRKDLCIGPELGFLNQFSFRYLFFSESVK